MDRITGLQDLQDEGLWLNWGLFGQDYGINRIEGCGLAGG